MRGTPPAGLYSSTNEAAHRQSVEQALQQRATIEGPNRFAGEQTGPFIDKGGAHLNVKAFGAKGNGTTDDTAAIRECLAVAGSSVAYFPRGIYLISEPLNLTNYLGGWTLRGSHRSFSRLLWAGAPDENIIETFGSIWIELENLWIEAPVTHPAQCGIANGRVAGLGSTDGHAFRNLIVTGYYSDSAMIDIASETNKYDCLFLENYHAGAASRGYKRTPTVPAGFNSTHATPASGGSNVVGNFISGRVAHFGGGKAVQLDACTDFVMYGTYLYSTKATVELTTSASKVRLLDVRHEGPQTGGNIIEMTTAGNFDLTIEGGSVGQDAPQYAIYGVDGAVLTLRAHCGWQSSDGINVDELHDSDIDLDGQTLTVRTDGNDNRIYRVTNGQVSIAAPVSPLQSRNLIHFVGGDGVQFGSGVAILGETSATVAIGAQAIANGAYYEATFGVGGMYPYDEYVLSYDQNMPIGVYLKYGTQAAGSMWCRFVNESGGAYNLPAGNLRVYAKRRYPT